MTALKILGTATYFVSAIIGDCPLFPKQCPELNPQDHLWREIKRLIVANRQFQSLDKEARKAERWFLGLSPGTARRKAGILSGKFWLKEFM